MAGGRRTTPRCPHDAVESQPSTAKETPLTVSLTAHNTTVSIAVPHADDYPLPRVIDELIRPLLIAAGYHCDLVDEALGTP